MISITKEFDFHAAHKLERSALSPEENTAIFGNCTNLHGHTYKLIVTVSGEVNENGMLINFVDLKKVIKDNVLNRYDHSYLNDLSEYQDKPSTCENMVIFIFAEIQKALVNFKLTLEELTLCETPTSSATKKRNA